MALEGSYGPSKALKGLIRPPFLDFPWFSVVLQGLFSRICLAGGLLKMAGSGPQPPSHFKISSVFGAYLGPIFAMLVSLFTAS